MPKETFPKPEDAVQPEDQESSFEAQFKKTEKYKVAGGTAEVVDIKPEDPKSEVPVFLAPAWACTTETYRPVLEGLSETDRRIIGINHPRIGGDMNVTPEVAAQKYPKEELRKAMNMLGVLDQKGIDKTDVIAHSEGAINTAIAAMLQPEKFRNIIFYGPAGLIGEDTFTRLLKGFSKQSEPAKSLEGIEITDDVTNAAKEALKYLAKNPVRGMKEAMDISNSQIHEVLRYLHEKGVGIVVIAGVDDPVFPMDRIQQIAKKDMLDGFLSVKGGHALLDIHASAAEKMLTALEKKEKSPA